MRRSFLLVAALLAGAAASIVRADSPPPPARPHNVIFMIPDGCGASSLDLARAYAGRPLTLDSLLVGACRTAALDARVTDSAAGATAFACGEKTNDGFIAMDAQKRPLATIMEAARARGKAIGLVATSRLTHATPACFVAHVPDRDMEEAIAAQELDAGLAVMLGGGSGFFLPEAEGGERKDGRDLVGEAMRRGVTTVAVREDLLGAHQAPLLGLFAGSHMNYEIDRDPAVEPSLREMTEKAIELVRGGRQGFVLMVEGSRIDHAAHGNDPAALVREVLAYDDAVAAAVDFARRDGATLVLSVADHETGGLSLSRDVDGEAAYDFRPETLRGVRASTGVLAARLLAGETVGDVLRHRMGIAEPTPAEMAAIEDVLAEGEGAKPWALENALAEVENRRALLGWTTHGHTAVDVGLYAFGPGAERFRGVLGNDEVGRRVAELLGVDLAALTARMRERETHAATQAHGHADRR